MGYNQNERLVHNDLSVNGEIEILSSLLQKQTVSREGERPA